MAKKPKKVAYVVFNGKETGIFSTWAKCEAQVKGYSKASFQGFETQHEADAAWKDWSSVVQTKPLNEPMSGSMGRHLQERDPNVPQGNTTEAKKPNPKRPSAVIDLTLSDDEQTDERPAKKSRSSPTPSSANDINPRKAEPVVLTPEQRAVVNMALRGENIFLTGAAGSGKTVTLKEILERLDIRKIKYQVVAPTGIAALPLGGKTTYAFMGWNPDSMSKPIFQLQKAFKKNVMEAVKKLKVLIIEEISMVENQFLERMNLVLMAITKKNVPFGGIQVIFLGDFHQLPPVKPFQFCLRCGRFMSKPPVYTCDICSTEDKQYTFTDSEKWAFKAPVWSQLGLRMVHLQQIHRQKSGRFQDILNKIRHGNRLDDREWHDLEKAKTLPSGIKAVRLMSLRRHVDEVNSRELARVKSPARAWDSFDSYKWIDRERISAYLPWETDQPLKQHRLSDTLVLKVGAKVVLLSNLGGGLVNGSQGEVVDFKPAVQQSAKEKKTNKRSATEEEQFVLFQEQNVKPPEKELLEPVVRFANGTTMTITAITTTTMYGTNEARYLASRTQVPLALAWALSIHKSQGMTLDYVEVSSRDIFERGQLYVALSRGTSLEGLIVTGTSREQLEVDTDVVEFYETHEWEDLSQAPPTKYSTPVVGRETICID